MLYIGIDVGGTFTDVIVYEEKTKDIQVTKVSTTPGNIAEGILIGLEDYKKGANEVALISHATTVATNALLTHTNLARTALLTNEGFRDILEIGRQRRAELYDLENKRPIPIVRRRDRYTVRGRILADGSELEPLSKVDLIKTAKIISGKGYESLAICFLNSYVNTSHEQRTAKIIRDQGFTGHVDVSSDVNREYREFERFSTTVVNASLAPLVSKYLKRLSEMLRDESFLSPIYVMNSDGSVSTIEQASRYPVLMIESGPAAGVLASRYLAKSLSLERILTFDMGGTTAKAGAVVNYEPDVAFEFEAAGASHSGRSIKGSGYAVRAPFIDLAEVSAGGGTIAYVDEAGALRVGPVSAGSDPGPAAYDRGGKDATVTDANIALGRINPVSLLGGRMKIKKDLAHRALKTNIATKLGTSVEEAARGILNIVNNEMARAISIVSVERGRDPRDYTLFAFGGAGPIHACDLAEELGISNIVIPPHAGLFSAYGLLTADIERNFAIPVMGDTASVDLERYFEKLRTMAGKAITENTEKEMGQSTISKFKFVEFVDARYLGQSYEMPIPYRKDKSPKDIEREFNLKHKEHYGYSSNDKIEIVNAKLRALIPTKKPVLSPKRNPGGHSRAIVSERKAWISNRFYDVQVILKESLASEMKGKGSCIIEEYDSTAVINTTWSWRLDRFGNLTLSRNRGSF
jgi:N-methylhydantoinase A